MDLDEMEDHGKYYMKGNTYIPKHQETEYEHFTEDIKNVFNDIVDLGSEYSVSYEERWYLTIVTINLNESIFKKFHKEHSGRSNPEQWYISELKDQNKKIDFKKIDEFCEDELEYRLERIKDLFGVDTSPCGDHILVNKDDKIIVHKYPGWKNVYVTKCRGGYEIHLYFGSVSKELPYGVKAKPTRNIDKNGRYID